MLGAAGLGRARHSVVGSARIRRRADVERMGRAARGQQRRDRADHDGQRHEHQRVQERDRDERGGRGPRWSVRSRHGAAGAGEPGAGPAVGARSRTDDCQTRAGERVPRRRLGPRAAGYGTYADGHRHAAASTGHAHTSTARSPAKLYAGPTAVFAGRSRAQDDVDAASDRERSTDHECRAEDTAAESKQAGDATCSASNPADSGDTGKPNAQAAGSESGETTGALTAYGADRHGPGAARAEPSQASDHHFAGAGSARAPDSHTRTIDGITSRAGTQATNRAFDSRPGCQRSSDTEGAAAQSRARGPVAACTSGDARGAEAAATTNASSGPGQAVTRASSATLRASGARAIAPSATASQRAAGHEEIGVGRRRDLLLFLFSRQGSSSFLVVTSSARARRCRIWRGGDPG